MTNPNDPAFPQEEPIAFTTKQIHEKYPEISSAIGVTTQIAKGLTKREEFAKAAMWAAYQFAHDADQGNGFIDPKDLAQSCVAYADALIAALNKASEGSGGE